MEETVKIAVRWRHTRTIDGKEEKEEEIVVQKLTKNVSKVTDNLDCILYKLLHHL